MTVIKYNLSSFGAAAARGEEANVAHVADMQVSADEYAELKGAVKAIGTTERFKDVLKTFPVESGTPAGFRRELCLAADGLLNVDLVRDISCDKNGEPRPTSVLFSADSANPYEVAPISPMLANLTCNPGIIYDLFINNPKANVGNKFKDRDEVMAEIGRILGPGVDISVELNNPFEEDFGKILEEAAKFREMLSPYRVVIKVPHTGAVRPQYVKELLEGDKKLNSARYDEVDTADAFRGHNLALKLHETGYRGNFTLMFEPYQTQLALQARPYFINTFLRHRLVQSKKIQGFLRAHENGDGTALEALRDYFISTDYYKPSDADKDLKEVAELGSWLLRYRHFEDEQGADGLDGMRHNLRVLKNCNMPDTRLIVCSMEGPDNYPDIDKLLTEPEFIDMNNRVVITAEPNYLARFTSTNQVVSYQRRFMNAAKGQK